MILVAKPLAFVYVIVQSFSAVLPCAEAAPQIRADSAQFIYVEKLDDRVVMQRSGHVYWGRLDAVGNFIHDAGFASCPKESMHKSGLPAARETNFPRGGKEEIVYEFRSGRLIKGKLSDDGEFVPDFDTKVSLFSDYQYKPDAIRIYNLPGSFKPKTK